MRFPPRKLLLGAMLVTAGATLSAGSALAADPPAVAPAPGTYLIDLVLAPVCLDGTYPLAIQTAAGPVTGSLTVTTDVRGRVSGSLTLSGQTFSVSGNVTYKKGVEKVALTARSGRDKVTLSGTLAGNSFTGTSKGSGAVADGKGTFTLDVSSAGPQTVSIVASLAAGKHDKLTGTGTATVCGAPLELRASASSGKSFKLTLSAKHFRFTGKGLSGAALTWTVAGYGASSSGADLALNPLPAPQAFVYSFPSALFEEAEPIVPNAPTTIMPQLTTFSIAPAIPAGLVFDVATGVLSGTPTVISPQTVYSVTATNPAGSAPSSIDFGVRLNRSKSFAPEQRTLTDDDLRHFLRRTQLGVRAGELAAVETQGIAAYVDAMLIFPTNTQAEQTAALLLANATDPPGLEGKFPSTTDIARWWTQIMVETPAPFQETLAFFWHDHFGVTSDNLDGSELYWMVDHVNLLRRKGNTDLRTLLLDVSRDPAMLKFLDGVQNTRTRPNENFAREVWELFSMGVDNGYTQADITVGAKAWTGYRTRFDALTGLSRVEFDASRHDTGAKTMLGATIPGQSLTDDYAAVVDLTLTKPQVAEYIATKLFEYFCYEAPPPELVATIAAYLRDHGYAITPFLKTLFTSEAFFSAKARRALVKSPVDFTVGFIRTTGLTIQTSTLDTSLTNQGQRPSQPPTVAGWPSGDLWLAAQGMVERINVVHSCVDDTTRQTGLGINVANLLPPVAERTPDAVIDTLAEQLDVQLSAQDRANFVEYLNNTRDAAGNLIASPFNGASQQHLDERVRGLLYALAQHPTYHSR